MFFDEVFTLCNREMSFAFLRDPTILLFLKAYFLSLFFFFFFFLFFGKVVSSETSIPLFSTVPSIMCIYQKHPEQELCVLSHCFPDNTGPGIGPRISAREGYLFRKDVLFFFLSPS